MDDPGKAQELVQEVGRPLMIVGHLPHLSRLASLLVLDTADREIIKFTMGGVVCLDYSNNVWSIQWALNSELIPK